MTPQPTILHRVDYSFDGAYLGYSLHATRADALDQRRYCAQDVELVIQTVTLLHVRPAVRHHIGELA